MLSEKDGIFGPAFVLMIVGLLPLVDRWVFAGMAFSGQIGFC